MQISVELCLIVLLVNFAGFFIKGLAGFGDPLITNPLLSLRLDNKVISPANLCLGLPLNAYISWKNRSAFSLKRVVPMTVCIMMGVIPGTLLLKYAASWVLKAFLGVLIIGIGAEMITRTHAKPIEHNNIVMAIVSFCSGVTAGLYGINLFFVAYVERTAKGRGEFRGVICFVFLIENIFRAIVYGVTGVFNRDILLLVLIAVPGMILGFLAGGRIDKRLSEDTVRGAVIVIFILGGIVTLVKALIWHT